MTTTLGWKAMSRFSAPIPSDTKRKYLPFQFRQFQPTPNAFEQQHPIQYWFSRAFQSLMLEFCQDYPRSAFLHYKAMAEQKLDSANKYSTCTDNQSFAHSDDP